MNTPSHVRAEVLKLAAMIGTARRLVCGGTMVELAALSQKVADICSAVEALPQVDGGALRPDLEALVRALDGLGEDLRIQHEGTCG